LKRLIGPISASSFAAVTAPRERPKVCVCG